ncbi:hypothetical protein EMPG_13536 [Blastomyces silverae]|uniref:Uncharacterized protein n=1 Tax=Blastomyces silverae TaxID=2060906 RepID=A0A0H1BI28_9EURO|nr:hypothetical protein EMPG_13536 [Blastomyces silverae]
MLRHWLSGYGPVSLHPGHLFWGLKRIRKSPRGKHKARTDHSMKIATRPALDRGGTGCWQQQDPGGQMPTS